MYSVIIGIGLDDKFLNPDVAYLDRKENVGQQEITRLMGGGKDFGGGPLPVFLREAAQARRAGADVGMILITRPEAESNVGLVEPLKEVADACELLILDQDVALWHELGAAIERTAGVNPLQAAGCTDVRFLIVGCHTDNRVLAIGSFLRNVLGLEQVAVSSHLSGSAAVEAHYAALRHNLPSCGIQVLLDLEDAAKYVGLSADPFTKYACRPCAIGPAEACEHFADDQRRIVEYLCMHWTSAQLRALQGGYSGSLLFLADGWKGQARTEPVVLKIDRFAQMRREISGYHQVKDFFGKHVPTFSHPVLLGESVGVAMEFAAMDGRPETLQDTFEAAEHEAGFRRFLGRLDRALALLAEKLYRNTRRLTWVAPYRVFSLHTERQARYLHDNCGHIMRYCEAETPAAEAMPNPDAVAQMTKLACANEDGVESEVCLDNIWFIDWTHSGEYPVEMDFAKLESDVKFVMSKQFELDDLPRVKRFEEYLLSQRLPAESESLPKELKYVKWDLRYRKILDSVRKIRETCFSIKDSEDWLVYQVALLKYATHTLSFDRHRDRGECEFPQLLHALYSVEALAFNLVSDDFHLQIRGARPQTYPPRQRISIDMALWDVDCDEYDPPYYVDRSVLENDTQQVPGGWADPEDFSKAKDNVADGSSRRRDGEGRPLNPRGRTGIAGRGLLGRWGVNPAAGAAVVRRGEEANRLDILVGKREGASELSLPKGFLRAGEEPESAARRILELETGWNPQDKHGDEIFEGFFYDPRQTDHAWVEMRTFLFFMDFDAAPQRFEPGSDFEEVRWMPLDAETVNRIPSNEARLIRRSIKHLQQTSAIDDAMATRLLAATG
jgi:ADP-ribose pyrophosphatase